MPSSNFCRRISVRQISSGRSRLADVLLDQFEDKEHGGFYFTSHDHESLDRPPEAGPRQCDAVRQCSSGLCAPAPGPPYGREPLPGGGQALPGSLFPVRGTFSRLASPPFSWPWRNICAPPTSIILRGPAADVADWQARLLSRLRPATMVIPIAENRDRLPSMLDRPPSDTVNAWVCSGVSCTPPVSDWAELERICNARDIG